MANFVSQIIFTCSLGIIVFLFARALPRVSEEEAGAPTDIVEKKLEQWIARLPLHKIDRGINLFLEKMLRRVRIGILKIDNLVHSLLSKVKSSSVAAKKVEEKAEQQKALFGEGDSKDSSVE